MSLFLTRKIQEELKKATGQKEADVAFRFAHSLEGGFGETWLIAVNTDFLLIESKGIEDPVTQKFSMGEIANIHLSKDGSSYVGLVEIKGHKPYEFPLGLMEEEPFRALLNFWKNGNIAENQNLESSDPTPPPDPPPPLNPTTPTPDSTTFPPDPTTPLPDPTPPPPDPTPTPPPPNVKQCSNCGTPLEEFFNGQIHIDRCPNCGGIFLDSHELDSIIGVDGVTEGIETLPRVCPSCKTPIDEGTPACPVCESPIGSRICPSCGYPMRPVALGEFIIDKCSHCLGLWFDKGELETTRALYKKHLAANPQYQNTCINCSRNIEDTSKAYCTEEGFLCEECFWNQPERRSNKPKFELKKFVHSVRNVGLGLLVDE